MLPPCLPVPPKKIAPPPPPPSPQVNDRLAVLEQALSYPEVVVVGGGYAGVELAAAVADRLKGRARVKLVTSGRDILEGSPQVGRGGGAGCGGGRVSHQAGGGSSRGSWLAAHACKAAAQRLLPCRLCFTASHPAAQQAAQHPPSPLPLRALQGNRETARRVLQDQGVSILTGAQVTEMRLAGSSSNGGGDSADGSSGVKDLAKRLVYLRDSEGQQEVRGPAGRWGGEVGRHQEGGDVLGGGIVSEGWKGRCQSMPRMCRSIRPSSSAPCFPVTY